MQVRTKIASLALASARSFGRLIGAELRIKASDHSLETDMVVPDRDEIAWDPGLYKKGNLFLEGYANPIKPKVTVKEDLEDPDTVRVEEGSADGTEGEDSDSRAHLIASQRYKKYMRQDLISQLLTPKEQWKMIAYGILAVGSIQFITIIIILWATGTFS